MRRTQTLPDKKSPKAEKHNIPIGYAEEAHRLEKMLVTYRKQLGIDPVFTIELSISDPNKEPGLYGVDAYCARMPTHPMATIVVSTAAIDRMDGKGRCLDRLLVHELLHITIGDAFTAIRKKYKYEEEPMTEETLVTRLAAAIVPLTDSQETIYHGLN